MKPFLCLLGVLAAMTGCGSLGKKELEQENLAKFCFGCGEWKSFTASGRFYEDMGKTAYDELHAILSKYVVQRPSAKSG